MIKVMIVDDEPKLRQGLQTLIPWEEIGFAVTAAAANGVEALEIMERERPDVLLVDIRMPLMDGLQLIHSVCARGWELQVIILSGYADFEYAKQAIKYGAAGYLLKPVDVEELTRTLEQAGKKVREKRQKPEPGRLAEANREWILRRLLAAPDHADREAEDDLRSTLQMSGLLWPYYEVVIVRPYADEGGGVSGQNAYRLAETLKPFIEESGLGQAVFSFPYVVLVLREPLRGREGRGHLYRLLHSQAEKVRFIAAAGGAVRRPEEIGRSFLQAKEALKRFFFSEREELLTVDSPLRALPDVSDLPGCGWEEQMESFVLRLYYSLDAGSAARIGPILEEAAAFFFTNKPEEPFIKEAFFHLCNALVHKLTASSDKGWKKAEEISPFLKKIFGYARLADLLEETRSFLLTLAQRVEPEGKEKELKIMIDIIHRHYGDNLKLETLAGMLNYSTAYLGQMFKSRTGDYFNTYLDKVRIQKAKELLEQGMKVYEVAERVGYANVNYFHGKFKKYVGCSPSRFRNP